MNIRTARHYENEWSAVDDDTYDGPGSPIGLGNTEVEAIADLVSKTTTAASLATLRPLLTALDRMERA